ncbi:hypothetical protein ACN2C7_09700 [Caulobacter sp. ErkDOM-E]|uniref:hypothetical protein n=1 Tax=Caulobacter sp. ErkDOM-E TaxID=3402778 RepID=UPI003AF854F6
MRNLLPATLSLALVPAMVAAQTVETIAIRVRGPSGKAVPSKIFIRKDGVLQTAAVETDANGERTLYDQKCDDRIEFRAKPNSSFFAGSGEWLKCVSSPVNIPVRQNGVTSSISSALTQSFPASIAPRRDALQAALDAGDTSAARAAAYDLSVYLRQAGQQDEAKAMAAVVVDQSVASLSEQGVTMPEAPLIYDAQQKVYVSTPETLAALRQFQIEAGIREPSEKSRPQWDLRTMSAISANEK